MKTIKKIQIILLICSVVSTASAATVSERYDAAESALNEQKQICNMLDEYNIPCDYEKLDTEIIKRYIEYGREDISKNKNERAEYTINILEQLIDKTKTSLDKILSGEKEQKNVPMFKSGEIITDGVNHIAEVEGGKSKTQPVFLNGYGHFFSEISSELSSFSKIGVNFVQIPIPARDFVLRPDYFVPGWQYETSGASAIRSSDIRKNGLKGGLIDGASSGSARAYQTVAAESGEEYSFSVWLKTYNAQNVQIRLGSDSVLLQIDKGTKDWCEYSVNFTADSDTCEIGIYSEGGGKVWFDTAKLIKTGDTSNILVNENLEDTATQYNGYRISDKAVKERITDILQSAQDNNVMVTFNLEPHNMPDWLTDPSQPGYDGGAVSKGQVGFLNYNIGNSTFRAILKAHIQAVAKAAEGYTSLHSVTLSNEGLYRINCNTSTFIGGYRTWLRDKYGEIENLRKAWGRYVADFDSIKYFPSSVTASTPESMDYNEYNAEVFMGWHEWMDSEFKAVNPGIKTHAKFLSGYILANRLGDGIDYERIANSLDYIGFDGGTSLENLNTNMRLTEDILSSCCEGKPLVNSETHTIPDLGEIAEYYGPEQKAVTNLELVQGYIHGRTASAMWVWRRHYLWQDYLNSIAFRADVTEDLGKTTYDINSNADSMTALQNAQKNIYLVWSPVAQRYNDEYIDCLKDTYNAALSIGQRVSFVTEKQLAGGKLTGDEILVLTKTTHLKAESYKALSDFAAKNGKIIAIGENLAYDEYLNSVDGTQIIKNAFKLSADADKTAIAEKMKALCEEKEKTMIFPQDDKGGLIDGVETRFAETSDGLLVNMANYTRSDINLSLYSNKYNLRYAKNIFTGEIADVKNMVLSELEACVLLFPGNEESSDIQVKPSGNAASVTWKKCADNAENPKSRVSIRVNEDEPHEALYDDFSYEINGLKSAEIYSVEISVLREDGSAAESVKWTVSPHPNCEKVVLDAKENNRYILTNMSDSKKNITVEAVYSNGNKSVFHIILKPGEATELKLLSGADITVKEA